MDRAHAGPSPADPLAELARLVGQDDPFRDMFKTGGRGTVARAPGKVEPQTRPEPAPPANARGIETSQMRGAIHDDSGGAEPNHMAEDEGHHGYHQRWDEAEQPPEYDAHDYEASTHHGPEEATHFEADADPEAAHHDYQAPPLTPDLWAQGAESEDGYAPTPLADDNAPRSRAPRRPLAVLAAVLLLTGGGLAATFVARSGPGAAVLGRDTPTIMAAAGPNKIKQDDAAAATTPEDVDSALLNRNNPASSGPTHVVNSQEQPVDLGQLPKAAGAGGDAQGEAQPAPAGSMFPEPKKVKTFVVRPDGTIVSSGSAPTQNVASIDNLPALASLPPAAEAPAAAPRPTTPKASARAATTPRSAPTTIADAAGGADVPDTTQSTKVRQPSSAGVKPPRAKPVEVADASASITPAATGQGGAYGLQLAAAPTEQEARDLFAKLQKKYSAELGPYRPTIRKADSGDRSIYRLRVSNLSQDQAKQICSQLQASGGSCFVVRN